MSSKIQEINGRSFSFGTLPAVEAVHVEVAIAKVIGEPMFKAFMELDVDEKTGLSSLPKQKMLGMAVNAMAVLPAKMEPDELIKTMQTVFKYVSVDGERVDINKHFTGRNRDLWVVFVTALRHNFSDFFQGSLSASLPDIQAM